MKNFNEIFAELQSRGSKKRMVAAWGVDSHTIAAAAKAAKVPDCGKTAAAASFE